MYESYILEPAAIAAVVNEFDAENGTPVLAAEVEATLVQRGAFADDADAALALKEVFAELTETRVEYRKVDHGMRITRAILASNPEFLQPLADFLVNSVMPKM